MYRQPKRGMISGLRRRAARLRDRFTSLMLLLTANALGMIMLILATIGPPPRWRIDALWVNKHAPMVRVAVIALGVAICASTLVMLWRRPRGMMFLLWMVAIVAAAVFFSEQLTVISRVVQRHAW